MAKLTLRDLIGYWEFHNRTEGKSPRTVDWYNQVLDLFERFLERERRSPLIDDIGEDEVRTFIAHLQQSPGRKNGSGPAPQGQSPETIQNRIRALKAFFAWLHRDGYTETYRLERLKNYKVPQTVKEVLTEDEIRRVLGCIDVREHWGARDYAIVMLMLDSGLRLSEVTGLQARDVELVDGFLKVMGKGSKERIVPFGAATQKALWRYQQQFRPEAELDDHFFRTLDGRPMRGETLRSIIKRLGERSGVPRLHPHLCRHTFATRYLINGGDVFSLQQILGHSTLEMVRRYVNLASAHVAVQHRKFSPMDHVALGRGSANGR